ncbi:MAG TPA: DnaJ domain-containing protein [Herpetosiphonaceae bacterium]
MAHRRSEPDYYTLLQVPPKASGPEIDAAYARLSDLYSAERMADAAPEFQEQAAQKREQLAAAYQVLIQPDRRAAYDRQRGFSQAGVADATDAIDYRPLPPARGQERAVSAAPAVERPVRRAQPQGVRGWLPGVVVLTGLLAVLLLIVLSGVRTSGSAEALATPTPLLRGGQLPFTAQQIAQFRSAAETSNTAATWRALGNALFDNLQTLRENAPQSPQYRSGLQGWLEVVQAYDRSLSLEDHPVVRADRAVALFNYGTDAPDTQRVAEALAEVERGIQSGVTEPRALLNYGLILIAHDPPRTQEALAQWRTILEIAPQSSEAQQAQVLLQTYEP